MKESSHRKGPLITELLCKEEVYRIVGCAMEVYNHLGSGFLEAVYQEAMELELTEQQVEFESHPPLRIHYKQHALKNAYIPDLVCMGKVIVELKALNQLSGKEESQVLNYLKASGLKVGLLLNFGCHGKLEWKRFVA